MPTFNANALAAFITGLFEKSSVPAADAGRVAKSLVDANLCGHDSHGVMRAPQYIGFLESGQYRSDAAFTVLNETPAVIAADGGWGLGQVQAHKLLARLIPKAKSVGVAAGTLRNCGHIGRLGEYGEVCGEHKLAFWGTVNSHGAGRRVAPPGGTEGRISTNPICLTAPTSTQTLVLDFGTSVVAEGKVRGHYQRGEPTPADWLVDSHGHPTTDASVLYTDPRGSIRPFGGAQEYKGFGLGLLLDMFAGGLSGGRCSNPNDPMAGVGNAVLFVVFDPAAFGGTEHFMNAADGLSQFVRDCPTRERKQITLPGDPESRTRAEREQFGIMIPDGTWALLKSAAEKLNVTVPNMRT